jgi:hypothetical protein
LVGQRAPWWSRYGRLTAYRVEKPYYNNPNKPPFTEKFVALNWGEIWCDGTNPGGGSNRDSTLTEFYVANGSRAEGTRNNQGKNDGNGCFFEVVGAGVAIINKGTIKMTFNGKEIFPEERYDFKISTGDVLTLPANAEFNPKTNSYERADYLFIFLGLSNAQCCSPNGPYGDNTGEICSVRAENYESTWKSSNTRLFYHRDGKSGLPAFTEDDGRKNYYFTSVLTYPVDLSGIINKSIEDAAFANPFKYLSLTDTYDDFSRYDSLGGRASYMRMNGFAWSADHSNFTQYGPTEMRWTRTKPDRYMDSYLRTYKGPSPVRVISGGGSIWGRYDLNFSTIE